MFVSIQKKQIGLEERPVTHILQAIFQPITVMISFPTKIHLDRNLIPRNYCTDLENISICHFISDLF